VVGPEAGGAAQPSAASRGRTARAIRFIGAPPVAARRRRGRFAPSYRRGHNPRMHAASARLQSFRSWRWRKPAA
jgi:hypothetical protein